MLKYKFKETEEIKKLLVELEALKIVFETIKPLPSFEDNLRRESILKSSVFSARIEGNPLTLQKAKMLSEKHKQSEKEKLEVFNLLKTYRFIHSGKAPKTLTLKLIFKFHKAVMRSLSKKAGQFRKESWGIFNQAGAAAYLAPSYFRLPKMMQGLVRLSQTLECGAPVKAGIVQFLFEKIHPFADGNGRVGRLISAYIMNVSGYGFRGLVSVEETIDNNRNLYYRALEPSVNAAPFVNFFLDSFITQAKIVLEKLSEKREELSEDTLLPRRREMLEIVRDHPYCSFDLISRRFAAINPKTLHYDLKKLQEENYILKVGKTRGALYKAIE